MNHFFYEATGNKFIIVPLWLEKTFVQSVNYEDIDLRQKLISLAQGKSVDSVLVLTGNPDSNFPVSMNVFEPRGTDGSKKGGSWSTMCGNGIRAVAQFFCDQNIFHKNSDLKIKTQAGILTIKYLKNNWVVQMGYATFKKQDLKNYLSPQAFLSLPDDLQRFILPKHKNLGQWDLGFTSFATNEETKDGEPHLVKETVPNLSLKKLINMTQEIGNCITKDASLFPKEVNVNIYSKIMEHGRCLSINLCTYERGVYYVTQSCGTGNTIVGASLLKNRKSNSFSKIKINNLGGNLEISSNEKECMIMKGNAQRTLILEENKTFVSSFEKENKGVVLKENSCSI